MWAGAFGDGNDYQRVCDLLNADPGVPGLEVEVGAQRGVIWDMPTGTADVWRRAADSIVVSRTWLEPGSNRAEFFASLPARSLMRFGELSVVSGWLVIVWAAESGVEIGQVIPADGRTFDLSVGNAGIVVALRPGAYMCYHDEVADGGETARRCLITPAAEGLPR